MKAMRCQLVLLFMVQSISRVSAWSTSYTSSACKRRDFIYHVATCTASLAVATPSSAAAPPTARDEGLLNYAYSDTWTGTALPLMDITKASQVSGSSWDMGRWPDPILRRPATSVNASWFGTTELERLTQLLQQTCRKADAVGLAAQQCGVDARIVYLEPGMSMINPKIVNRSDEVNMRVWQERCLVLPPTFVATVLRDDWIDVEYNDWQGNLHSKRLRGELARAAQHELDHDRGILVLDHVGRDELESDRMRAIESDGHDMRMALAYARSIEESSSQAV